MKNFLIRLLLIAGGGMLVASPFLPPGHQRNLMSVLEEDLDVIPIYIDMDEEVEKDKWIVVAYFSSRVAAMSTPIALGLFLAIAAFLPRGRLAVALSAIFHCLVLAALSATCLTFHVVNDQERFHLLSLYGGTIMAVLLLVEIILAALTLRGARRAAPEVMHFIPLGLYLAIGTGISIKYWNHEGWPSSGYIVMAVGATLGIVGAVWKTRLRRD